MFHLVLAIIYIAFISLGLPDSLLGSAWPSMYGGLGVPLSYAGIISMLIAGSTIASSLLSDRLMRKLGTGLLTAISVGMTATALFGFSISSSFLSLCLWAIPYGLGAGSVDAALNNFVALHYEAKHMSWLHCFWGVGATLGPYIMGASLTGNLGWPFGYRVISFIQIALTALLFLSLPLWKKHTQGNASINCTPPRSLKKLVGMDGAKQILVAFFCYCSLEMATGLWGSSYLVLQKGIAPDTAATWVSLFYLGITVGRFFSGFLTLRLGAKAMVRLGQGICVGGVLLLMVGVHQTVLCAGLVLIGCGCAPIYPSLLHQTPERFGEDVSQSMMGVQMACAYIGSTVSPMVLGFVAGRVGVVVLPLFLLGFVGLMFAMVEHCNRREKEAGNA